MVGLGYQREPDRLIEASATSITIDHVRANLHVAEELTENTIKQG